jgi:glycosyltransferase involved in cell wall biosynthesis
MDKTVPNPRLIVISPCHNEAELLPATIASMAAQTVKPARWIIVDDGSTDATPDIIAAACREHPWIETVRREQIGARSLGPRVVHTFNAGFAAIGGDDWELVSKMDCDLTFPPDLFERMLAMFADERLGITGPALDLVVDGKKIGEERYATHHVGGPLKIYRRACYEAMGGLHAYHGWDILDVTLARYHGWAVRHDPAIRAEHHRIQGAAGGALKGRVVWGRGSYAIGSHPLFGIVRGIYRMSEPPKIIGGFAFIWGFFSSYFNAQVKRFPDKAVRRFLRREQLHRIFHGNRLPPESPQ